MSSTCTNCELTCSGGCPAPRRAVGRRPHASYESQAWPRRACDPASIAESRAGRRAKQIAPAAMKRGDSPSGHRGPPHGRAGKRTGEQSRVGPVDPIGSVLTIFGLRRAADGPRAAWPAVRPARALRRVRSAGSSRARRARQAGYCCSAIPVGNVVRIGVPLRVAELGGAGVVPSTAAAAVRHRPGRRARRPALRRSRRRRHWTSAPTQGGSSPARGFSRAPGIPMSCTACAAAVAESSAVGSAMPDVLARMHDQPAGDCNERPRRPSIMRAR